LEVTSFSLAPAPLECRTLADFDLQVAASAVAFSDNGESLIVPHKPGFAFMLETRGSQQHNFYNEGYQRAEYADVALEVQDLWFKFYFPEK
jgi:hypothetical protein